MKNKGFTLIELMIVIAILGILAAISIPAIQGKVRADHKCVAGYAFTYGDKQILNEQGKGISCKDTSETVSTPGGSK